MVPLGVMAHAWTEPTQSGTRAIAPPQEGHASHEEPPTALDNRAGHTTHALPPGAAENVPAGHKVQADEPARAEEPAAHGRQVAALAAPSALEYVPAAHATQLRRSAAT